MSAHYLRTAIDGAVSRIVASRDPVQTAIGEGHNLRLAVDDGVDSDLVVSIVLADRRLSDRREVRSAFCRGFGSAGRAILG